jgi:outer membrane receptor protein involved in Fe transport
MRVRQFAAWVARIVVVLVSTLCLVVFFGECVAAQQATALLTGTIKDSSGAVIAGAKVALKNSDTNVGQTANSNKDGDFLFTLIPIGTYQVEIGQVGFKKYLRKGIQLEINQNARLDVVLEVGTAAQVVEVTGDVTQVDTVSDTIGTSVVGETIQRAPLNGRNVLDLALLQPGVTETNGDSGAAGNYSIAGGRSDSVTFLLDGGLNNNLLDNSVVFNPNPDTIAEFHILESNYSAEYGRNGGGVISVVTKSGTNQWHGSAFEFLRNDAFNANDYFNIVSGLPRNVLKRNQFGATFGGPITIPKLVSGRNRFFFFVGYQGQRLSQQETTGSNTVFTAAQLSGDFSTSGYNGGPDSGVACFLTGYYYNNPNVADGTGCGTDPQGNPIPGPPHPYFQSNTAQAQQAIIDPTTLNPIVQEYIALGLIPTNPNGVANYQGAHTDNNNELTMKFDFLFSEQDKLSATIGGFRNPRLNPFQFATVPGTPNLSQTNSYYTNAAYTHTFSSNLLNEFRLFLQRNNGLQDKPALKLPNAAQLNIGIVQDDPQGPPNLWFDNGLLVGFSEQGPTDLVDTTFGFSDSLSYIHGRHNWKVGAGVSAYRNNTVYDYYVNGEFDYFAGGAGTDNSLADFFLGIPSQYFQYPHAPSNIRSKSYYGFLQDEWRVSKRLTLDLGVRYEYNSPKQDTQGRSFSVIPGRQSTVFSGAPSGMVFPGDAGAPAGANFPDRTNWAPRLGFAWDPRGDGKTSIRGGFGMFYDILKAEDNLQFNGQPPFFSSVGMNFPSFIGNGASPYLADPFGSAGVPDPFPSHKPPSNLDFNQAGFLPINSGGSVYFVDPHLKTPRTYQYNLSVQHQVAPNTALEVSYVGNISHGLTSLIDVNPFVLGTTDRILNLGAGDSSCPDASAFTTSNSLGTCSFGSAPEFKNVSNANYDSLQASLNRQLVDSHYLGRTYFTLAYTYGHSIDTASGFRQRNSTVPSYNPNLFRASSDQDVRQRITFSGGWDLPFEHFWDSGPKVLTKGWSLFPIVTWRTGLPFDVFANLGERFTYNAEGPSGAGDPGNVHANVVGPLNKLNPRSTQTFTNPNTSNTTSTGNYYFNPSSLSNAQCGDGNDPLPCTPGPGILPADSQVQATPSLATYGTLPRNYFRGPGYVNFDLAFSKTTAITEHVKVEFRAEFFNIFNHANFANPGIINNGNGTYSGGGPGNNPNSSQFGQITSTYDPRIIQLAGRISF